MTRNKRCCFGADDVESAGENRIGPSWPTRDDIRRLTLRNDERENACHSDAADDLIPSYAAAVQLLFAERLEPAGLRDRLDGWQFRRDATNAIDR